MKNLVSIITPTYNSSEYISETIKSVLNQKYNNWELLITDDSSTDNTVKIINQYAQKDERIKIFKLLKNSGAAVARNNSIKHAKGNYLAFLDSDDLWKPDKLDIQIELINRNPECALFYSAYNYINGYGDFLKTQEVPLNITYKDLLKSCSIGCLTAVVNRNITGDIYMPLLKRRQDYAFWLHILRKHSYAIGTNDILADYRIGRSTISSNKLKVIKYQWKTYFEMEQLGFFKSLLYLCYWAINGFFKYYIKK